MMDHPISPGLTGLFQSNMPRSPFILILPRSCGPASVGSSLFSNSKPSAKSPKYQETALKSQMSPLAINQIHFIPQSIPPVPRGISVHPTTVNSSLHCRQLLRRFATRRPLTEAERSPAAMGRRSATAVGAVACLSGSSAKASTSGEEFVKKTVSSGNIVVFSKSYCPYCAMVKSIFKETNKDFSVIELDEREDGQDIQDALAKLVGRRTVPQVFIKGEHIGGCDDTMEAYESGRLAKLLTEIP